MAKIKVFLSYDFHNDLDMKKNFIAQSKLPDSPFSINDWSLNDKVTNWQQKAIDQIRTCDEFIVLLSENTHQASGVLYEVKKAVKYQKPRFQLHEQKHNSKPIKGAGEYVEWTWDNLKENINKRKPHR